MSESRSVFDLPEPEFEAWLRIQQRIWMIADDGVHPEVVEWEIDAMNEQIEKLGL